MIQTLDIFSIISMYNIFQNIYIISHTAFSIQPLAHCPKKGSLEILVYSLTFVFSKSL